MESSPPQRAWERPESPAASEYSLDLGALDMDTQSDIDLPKPSVDRIMSEDIDGPSDFTQNMDLWMRGGPLSKSTLRGRKPSSRLLQEDRKKEEQPREQEFSSLQPPMEEDEDVENDPAQSHHTPEDTPPKISVLEREPFSSEWQTYGATSTPIPPVHKQFLQPTVEDYYSELTPARQPSVHMPRGRKVEPPSIVHPRTDLAEEHSTPGRASSPTLSPVRSPLVQRAKSVQDDPEDQDDQLRQALELELQQLRLKCLQIEHLNQALNQAVDDERRLRRQEKAANEASLVEAARREKDLIDTNEATYQNNEDFKREFGELKDKLREQERQAEALREGTQGSERDLRAEVQRLRKQAELDRVEHAQEVKALSQDLTTARRRRDEAEEVARMSREELNEQVEVHEAETGRLRAELQDSRLDEAAIAELERRLKDATGQVHQLKATNTNHQATVTALRDQIAKEKQSHQNEVSRATADRTRAVELASNFQRQLQVVRQQIKKEQDANDADLSRLRSIHEDSASASKQEVDIVRAELDAKQTELNEAILERDEAQDALQSHRSEEESLRSQVADMEAINAELDARISEKLQRREKYWKDKLDEADRERQLMAKALLHQWGREEVGIDSPQLYAYKYLKKTDKQSPTKSPMKAKSLAA